MHVLFHVKPAQLHRPPSRPARPALGRFGCCPSAQLAATSQRFLRTTTAETSPINHGPQHHRHGLRPLGIYLHYPYCRHRCSYCAFNVHKLPAQTVTSEPYMKELKHALKGPALLDGWLAPPYNAASVYFGGGTPSLAPLSWFQDCIATIRSHATQVDDDLEVTVEANPSDVSRDFLLQLRDLGVNRLSLGVQSLDPATLRLFERDHSVETATRAIEWAKEVFPGRVSLDFIWGRPHQTVDQWRQELEEVLRMADDHLSLYQLTFERGTRLLRTFSSKPAEMPTEDTLAEMYHLTIDLARQHGFSQYEVSSFARTRRSVGKHNLAYWQGHDYLGIGPGAHGRVSYHLASAAAGAAGAPATQRVKTFRLASPPAWQAACLDPLGGGHGLAKHTVMSEAESVQEAIVFGLRMRDIGVEFGAVKEVTGVKRDVREYLDVDQVGLLVEGGMLELTGERLWCTDKGLAVVDAILVRILKDPADQL